MDKDWTVTRFLRAIVAAFAVALSACGGGGDGSGPVSPPTAEAAGAVTTSALRSQNNGFNYTIQVYVPASYATGTTTLPAIYVTEGDAPYGNATGGSGAVSTTPSRFDTFKAVMQRRGTQAILVGISGTARRDTDFLLPTASAYLAFITKELAPSIEHQYRADPTRRALSGLSHGGYFVVAALVMEGTAGTPSFAYYLSTDSSFGAHGNVPTYLDYVKQLNANANPLPTTLFLGGAAMFNGPIATQLYTLLTQQPHPGFTVLKSIYDTSHVGSDVPAFEEALTRFFP
ncbi:MAG: alpha/beta hydrolase-fold protein [Pseudomonadota bacterium]